MFNPKLIDQMSHSELRNYILPGLSSFLIGGEGHGKVRLFRASRQQHAHITPHSHRFDFQCIVLRGQATNTIWRQVGAVHGASSMVASQLHFNGRPGEYTTTQRETPQYYHPSSETYSPVAPFYSMRHDEIHSIIFSQDAVVLFLEGPDQTDTTTILEPWVHGQRIPTFKVEPWMFQRGEPA